MPNHCTNILSLVDSNKDIQKVLKPYVKKEKTEKGEVYSYPRYFLDFEKIIPMPKGIKLTAKYSSMGNLTKKRTPLQQKNWDKKIKALEEKNIAEYGIKSWYDWSVENWGTKWNSYDGQWGYDDANCFSFLTAWSPPLPVIRELSKLCKCALRLSYLDEGSMFVGVYNVDPDGNQSDECYQNVEDAPQDLLDEVGYISDDEEEFDEEEDEKERMGIN